MKYLTFLLLIVGISGMVVSCDKQLSAPPKNARVEGTAIIDQNTAQIVLNGAYYRLAGVTENNVTNWRTHHLSGGMYTGMIGYGYGALPEELNDNVNSSYVSMIWTESYLLLNAANGVIDGINALPDNKFAGDRKKELLGEAKFLRAYGHFRLLTYFGEWFNVNSKFGILLRETSAALSNIAIPRSTVTQSYDVILNDLSYAISNCPGTNPNYYATRWAAMGLKMRVLICRGQPGDYGEVISLANSIINDGPYALENSLKDLFYVKGLSSQEVIMGIKPQPNQQDFYDIISRAYYPKQSVFYVAKQAFKDLLQNDPRSTWMVGPASPAQAYSPNTYYFLKYIPFGGATSQLTETSYLFRLTEVYLLKAEAIIRSGGNLQDAKELIRTVMSKAGVTNFSAVDNANTPEQLLVQNYFEVLRNLTAEDDIERMALLRLPFATVQQFRPGILNHFQYIYPIPISELQKNPSFGDQNPGYNN